MVSAKGVYWDPSFFPYINNLKYMKHQYYSSLMSDDTQINKQITAIGDHDLLQSGIDHNELMVQNLVQGNPSHLSGTGDISKSNGQIYFIPCV